MTNITLDLIKTEHSRIAELIATLEAKTKVESAFPITMTFPELNPGERYVGAIISADGAKREHVILLPGELEGASWKKAMEWAKSIGGDLPNRCEGALLFATMKNEFKPEWHWTNEEHASTSDCAWIQCFVSGAQDNYRKSSEGRARAIRRLKIL